MAFVILSVMLHSPSDFLPRALQWRNSSILASFEPSHFVEDYHHDVLWLLHFSGLFPYEAVL